jgi:hypothetical protein
MEQIQLRAQEYEPASSRLAEDIRSHHLREDSLFDELSDFLKLQNVVGGAV